MCGQAEGISSPEVVSPEIKAAESKPVETQKSGASVAKPSTYSKLVSQVLKDSVTYNNNFSSLRFQNRDFFSKKNEENATSRRTLTQLK